MADTPSPANNGFDKVLFQQRLKAAIPPVLRSLEEFLEADRTGGDRVLWPQHGEEIRTIAECLMRLGFVVDACRLLEAWHPLQEWVLGPVFDELLADHAASFPEEESRLRVCCGEFPSAEELAGTAQDRETRDLGMVGSVYRLVDHLRQLQEAISAPAPALAVPSVPAATPTVEAPPSATPPGDDRHQGGAGGGEGDAANATHTPEPESSEQPNTSSAEPTGMSWQEVVERLQRLRTQGEPFTSQKKLADVFGCSSYTINKAIKETPALHVWAKARSAKQSTAAPRAQSLNDVVTDRTAQNRELDPADDVAIREYLEREDLTSAERAFFNSLTQEDQLDFLNDPDKHRNILGRKP
ncbi:MAG TPA: hypothetical protein VKA46_17210 [Gemmataceae bacterium]|nr:hypothetical protein [Gemmataceae bacterium]